MALLKKIKGSTLMETLVATVLIVVVFMVASMVLNNVFASSINQNTQEIKYEMTRLQYLQEHHALQLPYYDELGDWAIEVSEVDWKGATETIFSATNSVTKKEVVVKTTNDYN